jgi:hypothetical protein
MEKSDSLKNLAIGLAKFHASIGKIKKDSNNPFFKSKYAALPEILTAINQPMQEAGLVLSQFPTGSNGLTTMLIHAESGEFIMDTYTMQPVKNDPQGVGSCITYQRRYAIGAVLSLNIDEDDDANKASGLKPNTNQDVKPELQIGTEAFDKAVRFLEEGNTIDKIKQKYNVSKATEKALNETSIFNKK